MKAISTNASFQRRLGRFIAIVGCVLSGSSIAPPAAQAKSDLEKLAGKWHVVAEEFKGQVRPEESLLEAKSTLTVTGSKFVFETLTPEGGRGFYTGTAVLDNSVKPHRFDWTGTGPKGANLERLGLYELTETELKLVYVQRRIKGPPAERPTDFRTSEDDKRVIVRFQRTPLVARTEAPEPVETDDEDLEAIKPLLTRFPYKAAAGPVTVYSDISLAFSAEHAKNGQKVWAYFSKVFNQTPGDKTVWYYTRDKKLLSAIAKYTQWPEPMPGARVGTAVWNKDHRMWFSVPSQEPDFGAQIHEMSHDFLYSNYPENADYPWLAEGTGMYWESGRWDKHGDLVVEKALFWHLTQFQESAVRGELIPLRDLLTMKADRFYKPPITKAYAQSMVLVHYLMKERPKVMKGLIDQINKGEIKHNDQLVHLLTKLLQKDVKTLESEYIQFGLKMQQ